MTGDFGGLNEIARKLEALAKNALAEISKRGTLDLARKVQGEYDAGTDPYGTPWAAKKDGSASHLQASGRMRGGTKGIAGVKGIVLSAPSPAPFHQHGTSRMVEREIFPSGSLPVEWTESLSKIGASVIKTELK